MLKRNIVANYVGTAWNALMGIAFVPLYVRYLGNEAYGVVGIAATMQAYLSFLDAGLTPMLAREMSRFTGGAHSAEAIRSLLRVVEIWAWSIGALAMTAIWIAAPWIASDWLQADALAPDTIAHALRIMALVVALRFIEGLYRGCLMGLQRQVTGNMVAVAASTVRGLGAIGILAWWSPTLDAFFWWQGAVSSASATTFVLCTYGALPHARVSINEGRRALRTAWLFANGMLLSTALALAITQTDKILLSHLLYLSDYGKYFVALTAASVVNLAAIPVIQAFYPVLTIAHECSDAQHFRTATHRAARLVTVLAGTPCALLLVFPNSVVAAWTGDHELAESTAKVVQILAASNFLAVSIGVVHHSQLATGWTSVSNWFNAGALVVLIPMNFVVVPRFGSAGAATVWCAINVAQFVFLVPIILRRILPGEARMWYLQDTAAPMASAIATCIACKLLFGEVAGQRTTETGLLLAALLAAFASAAITAQVTQKIGASER